MGVPELDLRVGIPKDVLGKNCAYVGAKYSSQYLHLNKMCETTRNLLEILDQPVFESLL